MTRTSLIVTATGATAILALGGVALGVSAHDAREERTRTALTAATTDPSTPTADPGTPTAGPGGTTSAPGNGPTDVPTSTGATSPTSVPPVAPSGDGTDRVGWEEASQIALARVGGGRITEIERDDEDDRPVWSVEIVDGGTEYEVDVDRRTGEIVNVEREQADDDD